MLLLLLSPSGNSNALSHAAVSSVLMAVPDGTTVTLSEGTYNDTSRHKHLTIANSGVTLRGQSNAVPTLKRPCFMSPVNKNCPAAAKNGITILDQGPAGTFHISGKGAVVKDLVVASNLRVFLEKGSDSVLEGLTLDGVMLKGNDVRVALKDSSLSRVHFYEYG